MIDALTVFVALATGPFASRCGNSLPPRIADPLAEARACRADNACVMRALERQRQCLPWWRYPLPRLPLPPSNVEPTPAMGLPRA